MRAIPRAVAAIVGGWILGSVCAIPFALLILLINHHAAQKGVTIPNAVHEVVIGFLTGFFAGLIYERSGKLIGALAQVIPAAMVVGLVASVHQRKSEQSPRIDGHRSAPRHRRRVIRRASAIPERDRLLVPLISSALFSLSFLVFGGLKFLWESSTK